MSRVSVTGSKQVVDDVIETVHGMNLLHLTDYDGTWEGFDPGDPIEGADEASEILVTVRSLQSILGIEDESTGSERDIDRDALDDQIEEIRQQVNELDDRRSELDDELRQVNERIDSTEPFVTLGIDLDLLSGYDTLSVAVGEGNADKIERELTDSDVDTYEVFEEDGEVAVFARVDDLDDILVSATFANYDVPDAEGSPEEYIEELEHDRQQLESEIETVEEQLEEQRSEHGGFLLAAEEVLAIEVQRREAPLSFATTKNAFVSEGWVPSDSFSDLVDGLHAEVGEHVEVDELERASYDSDGKIVDREDVGGASGSSQPETTVATADGGKEVASDDSGKEVASDDNGEEVAPDGGSEQSMRHSDPPVIQSNPGPVKPFEILTKAVGRPNYSELDPTFILFLTFPIMFGFMIGDVGYGLVYMGVGYFIYSSFDSSGYTNIGIVALVAGFITALFGFFFGEIFGLHLITEFIWEPLIGDAPLKKGLFPANVEWAQAWFVISALFGVLHLVIAYVFEFIEDLELHGFSDAMLDSGSWLFGLIGLWIYIFSRLQKGPKPDFLFEVFNKGDGAVFALGFNGLSVWAGYVGIAMVGVAIVLLALGPTYELIEVHTLLAHPLSYLRLAAELLAEVGLAFAVNLLFFGAYSSHGKFHFMLNHGPEYVLAHHENVSIMFSGLVHGGIVSVIGGILILIIGHLIVLALGVMSVGIQAIRLEYFEYFSKFYDGSGITYSPFGYDRTFTTEE
jgi:V/A-type H+-transporting ATPase subunit I